MILSVMILSVMSTMWPYGNQHLGTYGSYGGTIVSSNHGTAISNDRPAPPPRHFRQHKERRSHVPPVLVSDAAGELPEVVPVQAILPRRGPRVRRAARRFLRWRGLRRAQA